MPDYLAQMYQIPSDLKQVLFGLMLSDGYLEIATNLSRFSFIQSVPAHAAYFFAVFQLFMSFCNSGPRHNKIVDGVVTTVYFRTRALPCFNVFYHMFYALGKKLVPADEYLFMFLTPLAIAHLVMGDWTGAGTGVLLCTDSFTLADCCRLVNFFSVRYGWSCTIRDYKQGRPRIYIGAESLNDFRRVVAPHMDPSMLYKLGL